MFSHIITFIVVLLIFNTASVGKLPAHDLSTSLGILAGLWALFGLICRWSLTRFQRSVICGVTGPGHAAALYQRLTQRLTILAVVLFALAVTLCDLKFWLQRIPGFHRFTVLQGSVAIGLFVLFLCTLWLWAYPAYETVFRPRLGRWPFVRSHLRLSLPVLFPWVVLTFLSDLLGVIPWTRSSQVVESMEFQLAFFGAFLVVLAVFLPRLIHAWWGCTPPEASPKIKALEDFLREKGFRYRRILRWPLFEGRVMTAGIMGIVPRYRYLLLTDALLQALTPEEIQAVAAHEMGHAKYRHLLYYMVFFLGFVFISYGLLDLVLYVFLSYPWFSRFLFDQSGRSGQLAYAALSLPLLASLIIYFRYVMGFFMRHFERQADLYSAAVMGTPRYTISSLEKIALFSGRSRDVPSWHHFSIRERVEALSRTLWDPGFARRHQRFLRVTFALYLLAMVGIGYLVNFSSIKERSALRVLGRALEQQVAREPKDVSLRLSLATLYQQSGESTKAIEEYEQILRITPDHPIALNNLAWLLVTASQDDIRDPARGLALARRAVSRQKNPVFLDTLAEAYWVNGDRRRALETIQQALEMATEDRAYYESQRRKFAGTKP